MSPDIESLMKDVEEKGVEITLKCYVKVLTFCIFYKISIIEFLKKDILPYANDETRPLWEYILTLSLMFRNDGKKPRRKWMMNATQILPSVLMVIDILAGVVCAFHGDVRRAVYWIAAAVLTAAVTF